MMTLSPCLVGVLIASMAMLDSSHAFSATVANADKTTKTNTFSSLPTLANFDYTQTNARLPYLPDGYGTWKWQGHDINYLELGDPSNPPLLLIHGFGASVYHFRHNIPELAKDHHVYAIDLLGFGGSDKPIQDYGVSVWRDQTLAFIQEMIQRPTVVAGNSLGGFTALYAAASQPTTDKPLITACVSLNGAGRFRNPDDDASVESNKDDGNDNDLVANLVEAAKTALQRLVIGLSFVYTKQPARIEQVLRQVYPVNAHVVDDELVQAIQDPSFHPNASEVFYRVITKTSDGKGITVDDCLETLDCPLLLCWGESDPWIRSSAADRMQALYPAAQRVSINAGHCPHDESFTEVNAAIRQFIQQSQTQQPKKVD